MTLMHAGVPALQDLTAGTYSCLEDRFIASVVGAAYTPRRGREYVHNVYHDTIQVLKLTSLNADCLSDTCVTM